MSEKAEATSKVVPGHRLRFEGRAIAEPERFAQFGWTPTRGGGGKGACSCGAISPELTSNGARKQWHREHKAAVLAERVAS